MPRRCRCCGSWLAVVAAVLTGRWVNSNNGVAGQLDPALLEEIYAGVPEVVPDPEYRNYRGHALVRVSPDNENHLSMLKSLEDETHLNGIDFWQKPTSVKRDVDFLVPPETKNYLTALMAANGFKLNVLSNDLQKLVDEEKLTSGKQPGSDLQSALYFNLSTYHPYDAIMSWLDKMNSICKSRNISCQTQVIGKSSEGRDLKVIKIGGGDDAKKPIFWIDAGIHAREWISPAVALHIINRLIDKNDRVGRYLVSRYRWYILPVANPDGYAFTWSTDRLWRKTRSKHPDPKVRCRGADPNRNWDFHWGGKGTSENPCNENYSGYRPFSEPETRAMADFLLSISDNLAVYLSLHSYGQYWLTPWGYTKKLPSDYKDLLSLGNQASESIRKTSGRKYTVGSASRLLYLASGGSDDWAKGVAGVKYAYTVELTDNGRHGFILPASMIDSTALELINAVKTLAVGVLKEQRRTERKTKE